MFKRHHDDRPPPPKRAPIRNRIAFSLVEMICASALVAGTLAPALAVMRDALELSRDATCRNQLGILAVRSMEYGIGVTMRDWSPGTSLGDFAGDGFPTLRYVVTRSDDPADGGALNRLMHVQVTVYEDANANSTLDGGENHVAFRTKVARLSSFENEPN